MCSTRSSRSTQLPPRFEAFRKRLTGSAWHSVGGSRLGEASPAAEVLADKPDGDGALTDGRSRAFDGAASNITGSEHPDRAGFEQVRIPGSAGLPRRKPQVSAEFWTRDDVSAVVERDGAFEPLSVWFGTDQNHERTCLH